MAYNYTPCPCVTYTPEPNNECLSPIPCNDPCATQAKILGKQTQPINCNGVEPPVVPPTAECTPSFNVGRVAYWNAGSIPNIDFYGGRTMETLEGTPTLVSGYEGRAWNFFESSMVAPDDAVLDLINTDIVISFWIKIVALPGSTSDVAMKLDSGTFSGWGVRMTAAGQLQFIIGNGSSILAINASTVPNDAAFHNIIFTFQNSSHTLRSHLDGVLTDTISNAQFVIMASTAGLTVGGGASAVGFSFTLDKLAIWHTFWGSDCEVPAYFACTDCDPIETCIENLDNNLIAYWKLDTTNNVDEIGGKILTNGPDASLGTGKIGNGATFTGTVDSYLSTPSETELELVGVDFTIRLWFKVLVDPGIQRAELLNKQSVSGLTGWSLDYGVFRGLSFLFSYNTGPAAPPSVSINDWHHAVITYKLSERRCKIYVDTVLLANQSDSRFVVVSNTQPLYVGIDPEDPSSFLNEPFTGGIDEILISYYPWTASDVACDYNLGLGRTYPFGT